MADIARLISRNAERWKAVKPSIGNSFSAAAARLVSAKSRYQVIQTATGVPWFIIAIIHEREASQRWDRSIAQGDPWNAVSVHVPKGRGPFKSWEDAAIDALTNCEPRAARWTDWSAGGAMTLLEQYNGLGYANRGVPSPYIWAGTNQYAKGKYVADGVYDPNYVDRQLGCAGMIMAMRQIDPTIKFADEIPAPPDVHPIPVPQPKPAPTVKHAASAGAAGAGIVAALKAHSIEMAVGLIVLGLVVAVIIHLLWPKKGN